MADAEKQLEELARITEQLNREMMVYGQISKQTSDQMLDAQVQSATGVKNFSKGMAAGGDAISALAGSAMAAGKAMYEGKKGAGAFNESLDGMAKAAAAAGLMLTLMIPGGPIIKLLIAGVTAAVGAMVAYTKAANDMADKLYKGFSGLAKSGAVASEGMTGVFKGAKKLGLSMNELDGYVGQVAASSQDLALFAGTAFEGRQKLEDMGQALEGNRQQFLSMGMSMSDVSEGMLGYLKLQTRIGNAQNMTTAQLAAGAKGYLIEMDGLSKMTGLSRKAMEDQIESARSEQRFRAKLEEVRATQGEAAAKRMETANVMLSAQSKEAGQGFRDMATGMLGTEAAMKYNMSTQGAGMEATQDLIDGKITEVEMIKKVGTAMGEFAKDMNMAAQTGTLSGFSIEYSDMLKLGILAQKDLVGIQAKVTEEQNKQGLAGKEAADKLLAKQAELIDKQIAVNKKMETAVFDGIPNAQANMIRLVGATDSVADGFTRLSKAINWLLNLVGLGEKTDKDPEEEKRKNAEAMTTQQNAVGRDFKLNKAEKVEAKIQLETKDIGGVELSERDKKWLEQRLTQKAPVAPAPGTAPPVTDPQKAPVVPAPGTPVERRAAGGPVDAKTPYLIGEDGPELFMPTAGGDILSNPAMKSQMSGIQSMLSTLGGTVNQKSGLEDSIGKTSENIFDSMKKLLGFTNADATQAEKSSLAFKQSLDLKSAAEDSIGKTSEDIFDSMKKLLGFTITDTDTAEKSSLAFKQSLDLKSAAEDSIGKTSEEIDAGMKKLLGFTNADIDIAEKFNLSGKLYALNMQASLGNILEDSKKLENLTDVDVKRAEKYSLAYKSYMDIKTDLITLETPDIKEQIKILQDKALAASGGGGAWGGESRRGSSSSSMGGGQGLSSGSASGMSSMGGGQGIQGGVASQNDLTKMGLKLKTGDVQAEGGKIDPKIIDLAQQVQSNMPNFSYFSGFNDKFHQEKSPSSSHTTGRAMDFALSQQPSVEEGQEIVKWLKSMGASVAIDEYNNPSSKSTAGHIHAQIAGYADGGVASTPQIAMVAEKGPEAMIPLDNGNIPIKLEMPDVKAMFDGMAKAFTDQADNSSSSSNGMLSTEIVDELKASRQQNFELLSLIQEMVRAQKDSNSIQEKILQTSQ